MAPTGTYTATQGIPIRTTAYRRGVACAFAIRLFADGTYKCTAQAAQDHPKDCCTAQIPEGKPVTLTAQWPDGRTRVVETVVPPGKFNTWTLTE